jgi:hypothetical protein
VFSLPERNIIDMSIYNSIGEKLVTLLHEELDRGRYTVIWDGAEYSSGVYIVKLNAGELIYSSKLILAK